MNIYNLLTEKEQEQVNAFSRKIQTEKYAEPMFYKSRMISDFTLRLFRENHPEKAAAIRQEQEEQILQAQQRIKKITWTASIYGYQKRTSDTVAKKTNFVFKNEDAKMKKNKKKNKNVEEQAYE